MSNTKNLCVKTKLTYPPDDQLAKLLVNVSTLYNEKQFSDVTLVCGVDEISVPAHRLVLAASSDFFLAAFRSNLDETNDDKLKIPEVDGELMKSIVDFMYTGNIELGEGLENVEALLKVSDFLQINSLITACSEFMSNNIDTNNCLGIAATAKLYRLDELYKKASKCAYDNFTEVGKGEEFFSLNADELKDFLSNIDECFATDVFLHLSAWVQHDKDSRLKLVLELFSLVKFKLLSPEFIIKHRNVICEVEGGGKLVLEWLNWHSSQKTSPKDNEINSSAVSWEEKVYIVGGCSFQSSFKCYDRKTNQIETLPHMSFPRQRPGVVVHNGNLYAVGGIRCGVWCREAERYDISSRTWSQLPSLNNPIVNIQLYKTSDYLYAVGENFVERWEYGSGWIRIHNMGFPRFLGTNRVQTATYFSCDERSQMNLLFTFTEENEQRIIKKYTDEGWQLVHDINLNIIFVDRIDHKQYSFNKGQWATIQTHAPV